MITDLPEDQIPFDPPPVHPGLDPATIVVSAPSHPMAVARELVDALYTTTAGLIVRDHRGDFYRWDATHWPEVDSGAIFARRPTSSCETRRACLQPEDGPTPFAPTRRRDR